MGGTIDYVWRDGARLTAWMLYVILVLDADLFRAFGVHVIVTSAIRTYAEQEAIFRARYVTAGNVNGRKVYDTRIWKGVRWYRISSAGTVAVPGTSNHEIQGTKAAVDIRDTGSDAGITVASSKRGKWIRKWCRDRGLLIASGDEFGEGWHFDVPNIFRIPPTPPAPTPNPEPDPEPEEEDDDMPKNSGTLYLSPADKPRTQQRQVLLISNLGSGLGVKFSSGVGGSIPADDRREFQAMFDTTSIMETTEGRADALWEALAKVRSGTA